MEFNLKAIARITVSANIERLVGGAGEATILAQVGEGIVSTIGSSDTIKMYLKIRIKFLNRFFLRGLIPELLLKFFQLILLMLMLVKISELNFKQIKLKLI